MCTNRDLQSTLLSVSSNLNRLYFRAIEMGTPQNPKATLFQIEWSALLAKYPKGFISNCKFRRELEEYRKSYFQRTNPSQFFNSQHFSCILFKKIYFIKILRDPQCLYTGQNYQWIMHHHCAIAQILKYITKVLLLQWWIIVIHHQNFITADDILICNMISISINRFWGFKFK